MRPTFEITKTDMPLIQKAMLSGLLTGGTPEKLYLRLINLYWEYYKQLKEPIFSDFSYAHLSSYLKSGYDYKAHTSLFQDILKSKGYDVIEEYLKIINYKRYKVQLTKGRIQTILGKGNTVKSENNLTKIEMIADIMKKIKNMEKGNYRYTTHCNNRILMTLLIINDEGASMQDSEGVTYQFILE